MEASTQSTQPEKKKIKNKKKDIINLDNNDVLSGNQFSFGNNFEDKTPKQIKEEQKQKLENKIMSQPLSSTLPNQPEKPKEKKLIYLDYDQNNKFLLGKLVYEIELLLCCNSQIDEKLLDFVCPLISIKHFSDVLEERDIKEICGNFLCGKKLKRVRNGKYKYDAFIEQFSINPITDMFCDKKCYDTFLLYFNKANKNFQANDLLNAEKICMLKILKLFYDDNKNLKRISELAEKLLDTFIRNHKEFKDNIEELEKAKTLEIGKILVES